MSIDENASINEAAATAQLSDDSAFQVGEHQLKDSSTVVEVGSEVDLPVKTKQDCTPLLSSSRKQSIDQSLFQSLEQRLRRIIRFYLNNYILLILSADVGVAVNVTCIKILSARVSAFQIAAVRSAFCSMFLVFICWWNGISLIEPKKKVPLYLLRGIVGGIAFLCLALCTFELPLSESAFISNSYPVVTATMSWLFGMEHLGILSWTGVCGCFIGNALVAHPPFLFGGHENWGLRRLIGIGAGALGNLSMGSGFILIRYIGTDVNNIILPIYMHLFSLILSLPFLPSAFPMPVNTHHSLSDLLLYGGTSLMGIWIQLASTRAIQLGPPSKVTSLFMMSMLLSCLVGVMALAEKMSLVSVIGAAIILVSVIIVTLQKPSKTDQYRMVSTVETVEELELTKQIDEVP